MILIFLLVSVFNSYARADKFLVRFECRGIDQARGADVSATGAYLFTAEGDRRSIYTFTTDLAIKAEDRFGRSLLIGDTAAGQDPIRIFVPENITGSTVDQVHEIFASADNFSSIFIKAVENGSRGRMTIDLRATATRPAYKATVDGRCAFAQRRHSAG